MWDTVGTPAHTVLAADVDLNALPLQLCSLRGHRLPHLVPPVASHRYLLLPPQVEGPSSGARWEEAVPGLPLPFPNLLPSDKPAPSEAEPGARWAHTVSWPCLRVPPCRGSVGSCVTSCTKTFSNHYSGISVLQGGEATAACPAKELAVDKTFGRLGDTCSIFWLSGTQVPS